VGSVVNILSAIGGCAFSANELGIPLLQDASGEYYLLVEPFL
jgi:hypothetical protein